jgi:hypothetical protein
LQKRASIAGCHAAAGDLIERTLTTTGLHLPERAMLALQTVLAAITHRRRSEEAEHLLA